MKHEENQSEARYRIVSTALDLFYRQGYIATGINQVIAEAGVSKNTFYYYFPAKDDLCVAYLKERHNVWMGWFNNKIKPYKNPYDRVLAVFDFLESWLTDCNFRGCAFLNITSEIPEINHKIRHEVISHKDSFRMTLRDLIEVLKKEDARFSKINVQFFADSLYVLFEGAVSSCQNYGKPDFIDAARKNFKKLLNTT